MICGGANRCLTTDQITKHLGDAGRGHWVLLQNETNLADEIVRRAGANGFQVAYSAAPFAAADALPLLEDIDLLCLNHIEAAALAQACGVPEADIPVPRILITRGGQGAEYRAGGTVFEQAAFAVTPVDTTGAGDTFLGAFLARLSEGSEAPCALRYAAAASAIQVTRPGAAAAIPDAQEVAEFMNRQDA